MTRSNVNEQQAEQQSPVQETAQLHGDAQGAGVQKLHYLMKQSGGTPPDPALVAQLLDSAPGDRHAMMIVIQQTYGNSYVQRLLSPSRQSAANPQTKHADTRAAAPTGGGSSASAARDASSKASGSPVAPTSAPSPQQEREAWSAVEGISEILREKRKPTVAGAGRYRPSLDALYAATSSSSRLTPGQRIEQFDRALAELDPAIVEYEKTDDNRQWVEEQLRAELTTTRSSLSFGAAKDRVDRSTFVDGKIVEVPDDAHPHEQAQVLRQILPKLIETIKTLSEQALRANLPQVLEEVEHMMAGHGAKGGLSRLLELQNVLMVADGWLKLSDEELEHHLHEIKGVANGMASYSEFVTAVIEAAGAGTLLSVSFAAAIVKLSGDNATAAVASGLAREMGHKLGNVVAVVEAIHSISVIADSHATRQQRIDAGANLATVGAWEIGKRVGGPAMGVSAASAAYFGYLEVKAAAYLFWQGNLGLTAGMMKEAFATLGRDGVAVASAARDLTACQALVTQEHDPRQLEALGLVADSMVKTLGNQLDVLLDDCGNIPLEAGMAKQPGTQRILREAFAPLQKYRGVRDPAILAEGASRALERIMWVQEHAATIVTASAHQEHLADVEADEAKAKEEAGEHVE